MTTGMLDLTDVPAERLWHYAEVGPVAARPVRWCSARLSTGRGAHAASQSPTSVYEPCDVS